MSASLYSAMGNVHTSLAESRPSRWPCDWNATAEHGVVRWRRIDLARVVAARFGVTLAERTVGGLLRELGFRRLSVRPRHPGQDAAAQASFRPGSPAS